MSEIWRPVPGHDGYFASDAGRIRGKRGGMLKPRVHQNRPHVSLSNGKDNQRLHPVANLVWLAFAGVDAVPDGYRVWHYDNDPANVALVNLCLKPRAWQDTRNMRRGELQSKAKLTEQQVREIRRAYAAGEYTMDELAARYGVTHPTILDIIHRNTWKHVE